MSAWNRYLLDNGTHQTANTPQTRLSVDNMWRASDLTPMTPCCLCTCRSVWPSVMFSRLPSTHGSLLLLLSFLKPVFNYYPGGEKKTKKKTHIRFVWSSWRNITPLVRLTKTHFNRQSQGSIVITTDRMWLGGSGRICIVFVKQGRGRS